MGGTTAAPPPQAQQRPTVTDLEAHRFMNGLANDKLSSVGASVGGIVPLQVLIEDLHSDAAGTPKYDATARAAAAEKLINSFGVLGNRPLPQEMQRMIQDVFNDPALTNAEDMARRIRESNFTADFVQLIADNQMNFGNVFGDHLMVMMHAMFPEFAQLLEDLGLGDNPHETNADRRLQTELAEGWEAWQNGRVHEFNEIRAVDESGQSLTLNSWRRPSTDHDINEFFGFGDTSGSQQLWGDDEQYRFTEADPHARSNTFAGMILQRWEDEGVVSFDNDEARQQFVQRSYVLAVGGELDGTFADTLVDRDVIEFSSPDERQAFIDHMVAWRGVPGGEYRDAQEIMQEVINYVNQPGGAEWVNPNFSDETATEFSTTQSAVYRVAQQYSIARDGEDYARQMIRFAEEHPDITITAPAPPQQGGPSAAAGNPNGGVQPVQAGAEPNPIDHSVPTESELDQNADGSGSTPDTTTQPDAEPEVARISAVKFDSAETSGYLDYGQAITGDFDATSMAFKANDGTEIFKFTDDFEVFGVNVQNGALGGHTLIMDAIDTGGRSPQEILSALGDDFKVSVVAHQDAGLDAADSELFGFYVESADGQTSFYVGPSAIEEGSMTSEGRAELVKGIEESPNVSSPDYDVTQDPNNTASIAANSGLGAEGGATTVDQTRNNMNIFQP